MCQNTLFFCHKSVLNYYQTIIAKWTSIVAISFLKLSCSLFFPTYIPLAYQRFKLRLSEFPSTMEVNDHKGIRFIIL